MFYTEKEKKQIAKFDASFDLLSFLINKSKKVEEAYSGDFTHKCICPFLDHKGGEERSPSFYFSTTTNTYKCFGCDRFGTPFTLVTELGDLFECQIFMSSDLEKIDLSTISAQRNHFAQRKNAFAVFMKKYKEFVDFIDNNQIPNKDLYYEAIDNKIKTMKENETPKSVEGFFMQLMISLKRNNKI